LPKLIIKKELALRYYLNFNRDTVRYLSSVIIVFIYPALYEEFLFRGLLVSGLKGFFNNECLINITQAIVFGLMHFSIYTERGFGIWSPVFIGSQVILGYLLGSLYLKTRSLTPSIILHTLFDIL
jgi:membrane protease YdiL (CAAX protease family)